jgi:glucose-6-phosphate 1-dehydrogenase
VSPPLSDALVLFGATGDLAYKQIFPALQALIKRGALNVPIICVARERRTLDKMRERVRDSLEHRGGLDRGAFDRLVSLLRYVSVDYTDPRTFTDLCRELGVAKRPLYYLAIPPAAFPAAVAGLQRAQCTAQGRIALEKPFGRDLASARALNTLLQSAFPESSIFRIDHYLGKEPVQNLLYTRFANSVPEPLWDRDHIDHVQITMAEKFGVEGRGRFYEETGAIRDVIQNHMLQVVALLAMDPPVGCSDDALRDENARILRAIGPLDPAHVVRGQFRGYRDEPGVARGSLVETYAAVRFDVHTWRWTGVPFFVRAGKCLPATVTEVLVRLKRPPRDVFGEGPQPADYFRFRLSPEVSVALSIRVKQPGEAFVGRDKELVAIEDQAGAMLPYERLLGDAMKGDPSLFARADTIDAQWRIVDPVLDQKSEPLSYAPGTRGARGGRPPRRGVRRLAPAPGRGPAVTGRTLGAHAFGARGRFDTLAGRLRRGRKTQAPRVFLRGLSAPCLP